MSERTSYEPGTPCWADVTADDVDALISFYEELFGWEAGEASEQTGGYRIFMQGDKAIAGVGPKPPDGGPMPTVWSTYLATGSADETAAKVKAAGGSVVAEPMDVADAGRMAFFSDPQGAVFGVWEAGSNIGAELVNEPVSICWNEVRTSDPAAARAFYGEVFGYGTAEFEGMDGYEVWTLGGDDEGIGGLMDIEAMGMPGVPDHWGLVFAVEDADRTAAKARELGGTVVSEPADFSIGRVTTITDPQGATFGAIRLNEPG